MRIGQNPAKSLEQVARPSRITVAVLNYIPFISGFYAEVPEVLKACLDSIRENTDLPYDLLVFDNGSCAEVRQFLQGEYDAGRIQYLVLSQKNLGKGGAWNVILNGAPGEVIAYSDNDVLFYKGWLSRSVEILESYPNVGMVTARPFRSKADLFTSSVQWAKQTPEAHLEEGQFIPWESFLEFNLSLGHDADTLERIYKSTKDFRVNYHGITAYLGASHWQFVAYKSVLQQFLPFDMEKPMGQARQLDKLINDSGCLRLMISDPLAMNMSNTPLVKYDAHQVRKPRMRRSGKVFLNLPVIRKFLMTLYNAIFRWYYD